MRPSVICSADPSLHRGKRPPATPSLSAGMARCRTMRLGAPQPPAPSRTPARAIDDKDEPANAIQGNLEALRGCRRLRPADPSHGTDRLAESLAPSCHERPAGGLGSRVGPFDANVDILYGFFGGMVSQVRVWPKRTPALCQCWGDGGGNDTGCDWLRGWFVYGRFRKARGWDSSSPVSALAPPPIARTSTPAQTQSMLH